MIPIGPNEEQGEHGDYNSEANPAWSHRKVEKDDVENDRAKNRQAEHGNDVKKQEQAADNLAGENHLHIASAGNGGEELSRRTIGRRHFSHRNEMEETIESEDDETQPEQQAHDNGENFHWQRLRFSLVRINLERPRGIRRLV